MKGSEHLKQLCWEDNACLRHIKILSREMSRKVGKEKIEVSGFVLSGELRNTFLSFCTVLKQQDLCNTACYQKDFKRMTV